MYDRRLSDTMNSDVDGLNTTIGEHTQIKGNITEENDVILYGKFDGEMNLNSMLFVKRSGDLKGKVKTDNMIIEGEVDAEIVVKNKIEIRANGRFNGQLTCKQIAIEEGAFFQGSVIMEDGQSVSPTYFKEKRKELQ